MSPLDLTAAALSDWLRGLHAAGMSISTVVLRLKAGGSGEWEAAAMHSGFGSYSSPQTRGETGDVKDAAIADLPGVKITVMSKPPDKILPLGKLDQAEAWAVLTATAPMCAAHEWDRWDCGNWMSMSTWALNNSLRAEFPPEVAEGVVRGEFIVRNGSARPGGQWTGNGGRECQPPTEEPVVICGRKMLVARPCGCVTQHWQAPGKGHADSQSKRKFGAWLAARPCKKHEK